MKDKEKSTVAIGEIIKQELKNQGKTCKSPLTRMAVPI